VLLAALLIVLWAADKALGRDLSLLPSSPTRPLIGLAVVTGIAFLAGGQPWQAFARTAPLRAQAGGVAVFLLSIGAFLLMVHQVRDVAWLRRLTWLYLAVNALLVIGWVLPGGAAVLGLYQPGSSGSLMWTWVVALAASQALLNRELGKGWRLALVLLALGVFVRGWLFALEWASGWLPPLVAVVVIVALRWPKLSLALVPVGLGLLALRWGVIERAVMVGDQQYSLLTRTEAWRILVQIIRLNPVLGLGPANYYWYTPLYSILGYYVQFNSHNNYMDIVAQVGLLGLGCFLWFVVEVARQGWRLLRLAPSGFARAYAYGAVGGLAGTLVAAALGDWLLPFVYNVGLAGMRSSIAAWLFLGGLAALYRLSSGGSNVMTALARRADGRVVGEAQDA
jgi:hypothetical protein